MAFQERLQELRKEKGLSQEKLAEKIGVSRQAIAKWETGQSYPDMEKLILLGDIYQVSLDRLMKDGYDEYTIIKSAEPHWEANEDVIEFLIRAIRNTYAGKGPETAASRPNSHDFVYIERDLKYIDTYLGGNKFAGEAALWSKEIPFWSINYCGRIIDDGFSGDFLKECLLLVTNEYPYRGPLIYDRGDYRYHCIVNGTFEWFNGYEEIFCGHTKVYECVFHGGSLQ